MNVSPATARVIYELTNTGQVVNNRGRDLDRHVVAELALLLNLGANASARGTSGVSDETAAEDFMLSGATPPTDRAMSTAAVADHIGISDRGVRLALAQGRLAGKRVGKTWIVSEADARRFANERKERAA